MLGEAKPFTDLQKVVRKNMSIIIATSLNKHDTRRSHKHDRSL